MYNRALQGTRPAPDIELHHELLEESFRGVRGGVLQNLVGEAGRGVTGRGTGRRSSHRRCRRARSVPCSPRSP